MSSVLFYNFPNSSPIPLYIQGGFITLTEFKF
uniref:Uncharacterized protein n=1 Tax=Arundo donax TaxID=35708 RepID=A0A0A8Y7K1_ARUDO